MQRVHPQRIFQRALATAQSKGERTGDAAPLLHQCSRLRRGGVAGQDAFEHAAVKMKTQFDSSPLRVLRRGRRLRCRGRSRRGHIGRRLASKDVDVSAQAGVSVGRVAGVRRGVGGGDFSLLTLLAR